MKCRHCFVYIVATLASVEGLGANPFPLKSFASRQTSHPGRRNFISSLHFFGLTAIASTPAVAQTRPPLVVGSDCENRQCLGAANGLLSDCDSRACVSSQDDATGGGSCFAEPWEYESGSLNQNFEALKRVVVDFGVGLKDKDNDRVDVISVVDSDPTYRYLRVAYTMSSGAIDDCEFYMPANDVTVQFRSARRGGLPDFGENKKRMEAVRKALNFSKVPVIRNRKRVFFFAESPFDSFGPPTGGEADDDPQGYLTKKQQSL